ncbi:MAG: SPOR domain-containing protein, partial [Hyphomicrobiales bacterium]|nr:SPOR domain-containing protein [Hyphomicrobiales bacterium]
SGFNLLTSARLGNRHIIAVVLGGRSGRIRDNIMAGLVAKNIQRGSTRTRIAAIPKPGHSRKRFAMSAPVPPRASAPVPPRAPVQVRQDKSAEPIAAAKKQAAAKPAPRPIVLEKRPAGRPMNLAAYAPVGRPAVISGIANSSDLVPTASIPGQPNSRYKAVIDGSTRSRAVYGSTTARSRAQRSVTPSELRWVRGPAPVNAKLRPAKPIPPAKIRSVTAKNTMRASAAPQPAVRMAAVEERKDVSSRRLPAWPPKAARSGVVIQVGATDDLEKAHNLLDRARSRSRGKLSGAKPFTEPVRKNGTTLYRARFAGLTERSAHSACRTLKRSGMGCFTTRY